MKNSASVFVINITIKAYRKTPNVSPSNIKINKFAELRASTRLRAIRAFVPYVPYAPSCLTCLRVLRTLVLSRLTCLTHAPYLRALRALFVHLTIFLGWFVVQ